MSGIRGHAPILAISTDLSSPRNEQPSAPAVASAILGGAVVANAAFLVGGLGAALGTLPIDACYYVAKASSLAETGRLRVPWGNGIDAKFFPGLSVALAAPLKVFGFPWGWIVVELVALVGAAWLTAKLARRVGSGAVGAACAAAAFAADPLVVKWASVPYAELPAVFLALAAVEAAFRGRESGSRWKWDFASAALLGAAIATRAEAAVAAPVLLAIAASGRAWGVAAAAGAGSMAVAALPLAAHLAAMASLGVAPSRLHYIEELLRNFDGARYARNLGVFFEELAHLAPPKRHVAAELTGALAILTAAARYGMLGLTLLGAGAFLRGASRGRAAAAMGLLLVYPFLHAFWYYTDGRFLLLVWPVVAVLAGRGAQALLALPFRGAALAAAAVLLGIAAGLLALGSAIAEKEVQSWEDVTGGPAVEVARRIDALAGADAEGIYELERGAGAPAIASGPFVAAFRRAPARFAYAHPEFFEPDVRPEEEAALLKSGKRFVLTNLGFEAWLARRVPDAAERAGFQALLEEPGRTLIVKK